MHQILDGEAVVMHPLEQRAHRRVEARYGRLALVRLKVLHPRHHVEGNLQSRVGGTVEAVAAVAEHCP